MKFRNKYTYEIQFGKPLHMWTSVTQLGGMHLHIRDGGENAKYERYTGGIEMHYRSPPAYKEGEPPSHDDCFLLHQPCWHDGSSLQASEFWIPFWAEAPNDHDRMFSAINTSLVGDLSQEVER